MLSNKIVLECFFTQLTQKYASLKTDFEHHRNGHPCAAQYRVIKLIFLPEIILIDVDYKTPEAKDFMLSSICLN